MARSDLLVNLVGAGANGDKRLFRDTVEAIIAEERSKQHHIVADKLTRLLGPHFESGTSGSSESKEITEIFEIRPQIRLEDLFLGDTVKCICKEFIEENNRIDLLRSYGIEPRNRILLTGPPGNGKTSLAEALANELMLPLFVIKYEEVIGSFLGETSSKLQKIFNYVRTRRCILFFDEFDTISKERADIHETGEIKRVVSSLLLQIDNLSPHVIVISASNHPELLDSAVWRRFQIKIDLKKPTRRDIEKWLPKLSQDYELELPLSLQFLAESLVGLSFSEILNFWLDCKRKQILTLPNPKIKDIFMDRLKLWKTFKNNK